MHHLTFIDFLVLILSILSNFYSFKIIDYNSANESFPSYNSLLYIFFVCFLMSHFVSGGIFLFSNLLPIFIVFKPEHGHSTLTHEQIKTIALALETGFSI